MRCARSLVAACLMALACPAPAKATPRCSLAAPGDPCKDVTPQLRSDRATPSPWLDEGARPPWMAPAAEPRIERHRVGSMVALTGLYASVATFMYFAWYYGHPALPAFTVGGDGYFGENTYAGGSDKLGHAWAPMLMTRAGAELLRWGGWSRRTSTLVGAGLALSMFAYVEVKDGYYYQFSPGDLIADTAGVVLGAALNESPALDRLIDFRVSYWPSPEYISIIDGSFMGNERINSINFAEDYSGHTYFLALHVGALPRPAATPRWLGTALDYLDVGVGFQATRYKPDPPDEPPYERRQKLFLGATIDLQRVVDRGLRGRRGRAARWGRAVGHAVFELASPPFVIVPVASISRSPDD